MFVFVYGTLLRGLENHHVLSDSFYVGPGIITARMVDLGEYPGAIDGPGVVVGEVYNVNSRVIAIMDELEDYEEKYPESSCFIRKNTDVWMFSGEVYDAVECYFYNKEPLGVDIVHGDYRRYRYELTGRRQWILCYGSNMNEVRLKKRIGNVGDFKRGFVNGFKLVFNKRSSSGKDVFANLVYTGVDKCPAVVFKVSLVQLERLDVYEGVNRGEYLRVTVPFVEDSGRETVVQCYLAHPGRLSADGVPPDWYLNHIRRGYKRFGFDENAIEIAVPRA